MHLETFIERSRLAPSVAGLVTEFKSALSDLGFDYVACAAFGGHALYKSDLPAPVLLADYPQAWIDRYVEANYIAIDPVVVRAPFARVAYSWDQLDNLNERQRLFFAEAAEAGLRQGVSVPLHGPNGELFLVSAASSRAGNVASRHVAAVQLLATQFHSAYVGLVRADDAPPVHLTDRERECLLWSARGKSSWDIGTILKISENTVNFHIKNATAKLGVANRLMAIVKAIRLGLVSP